MRFSSSPRAECPCFRLRPLAPPKTVAPAEYLDVAQKMLFSKDRNPNVIVEPEKPKPEPPMPALPSYYGQMTLFDPVVFLALGAGGQKSYHPATRWARSSWSLSIVKRSRSPGTERRLSANCRNWFPRSPCRSRRNRPPLSRRRRPLRRRSSRSEALPIRTPTKARWASTWAQICTAAKPGDTVPNGTVTNGYKKVIVRGLMGDSCHWEQVK